VTQGQDGNVGLRMGMGMRGFEGGDGNLRARARRGM
jgi:hypothetical protein